MIYIEPSVRIVSYTPDALRLIEEMGRICHKSEEKIAPGTAEVFVAHLVRNLKHHSVLEHATATVVITADRGLTHELVRHRIGVAYSQESTRYCNYGKGGFIQVCPMNDGLTDEQLKRRHELWEHIEQVYLAEVAEKVKPQQARDVLPTCLKTEIGVTNNFRAWRNVFEQRCAPSAHPRIAQVTQSILRHFAQMWPPVFDDQALDFLPERRVRW